MNKNIKLWTLTYITLLIFPLTAQANSLNLSIPILFGVELKNISSNFGAPRDGGARSHIGLDIMTKKGLPIVSPVVATVTRAGTGGSEGIYVNTVTPSGDKYIYYHLDKIGENIKPGITLNVGDLIGYVGNTGNASGGADHLHFEIHQNNAPVDPYPHITKEFSLTEKISILTNIISISSDSKSLINLLITNYSPTFYEAIKQGLILPAPVNFALLAGPTINPITTTNTIKSNQNDLELGDTGTAVTILQNYLITANKGGSARTLAETGATGYFGPLTQKALAEFQALVGIKPATGYYGPLTQTYIAKNPIIQTNNLKNTQNTNVSLTQYNFTRDLKKGMSGEDVLMLQKILNNYGFIIAPNNEPGSPGNETNLFGAATEKAVIQFQKKYYISPAHGYVGPQTRSKLISL